MTTVMSDSQNVSLKDDSYKRQPERTARACAPLYEGSSCVSAATFRLSSCITHWEVYRARAINIQLCAWKRLSLLNV